MGGWLCVLFGLLFLEVLFSECSTFCVLCISLHEIHALLWFVPSIKAEILALSIQIRLCVQPGRPQESVKGWPSHTSAWRLSCCEHPHQKAKVACICLPEYYYYYIFLLYSICFSKCTTFFLKPFLPSYLSPEMFLLLCAYFFRHWNPALPLIEVQNGWAPLKMVSDFLGCSEFVWCLANLSVPSWAILNGGTGKAATENQIM